MKILIVSAYFFPTNSPRSFRTTELAKEFARQGHQVKVIFPDTGYDYREWESAFPTLTLSPMNELVWKDIVLTGGKLTYLYRRIRKRLQHLLFEYPSIEWFFRMPRILRNERRDYDLLISIAVPHTIHWGIARCIRKGMKPAHRWIADCGDPFMGCITDTFRHPFYFAWFEKAFCRQADYITVPVDSAKAGYYPPFRGKIRVIPQGFSFREMEIAAYTPGDYVQFCYAGGFIAGIRDPRPILEALLHCPCAFRFYIFTNQPEIVVGYRALLGEKLIVSGYIPRLELIRFMSTMDFLLNIENGTAVQVPSKLIDYSLSSRPILSLSSVTPDKEKLMRFLNRDYTNRTVIADVNQYNIEHVARSFIDLSLSHVSCTTT